MYWLILFFVFIFLLTISQLMLNMLAMGYIYTLWKFCYQFYDRAA